MSETMQKAINLLNETNKEFSQLSDTLSDTIASEDFSKVNLAYTIASQLNVYASQLSGEQKVYEGPCKVNNTRAEVVIDGFVIRGDVQFEVLMNDKWEKGHRTNSQYGQVFVSKTAGTVILHEAYTGRVTLPLVMDC